MLIKSAVKKIYLILFIIFSFSCAFHTDVVERNISLSIANTKSDTALFFPMYMPEEIEGFQLWENVSNLLKSYDQNSEFLNDRYYYFESNENKKIEFYYEGNLRMGVLWILPPIGLRSDKNTYFLFTVDENVFLFKSGWETPEFEIYKLNENSVMNRLSGDEYSQYFLIDYSVLEEEVLINDREQTKKTDRITLNPAD